VDQLKPHTAQGSFKPADRLRRGQTQKPVASSSNAIDDAFSEYDCRNLGIVLWQKSTKEMCEENPPRIAVSLDLRSLP
jgi:hypothetical protein